MSPRLLAMALHYKQRGHIYTYEAWCRAYGYKKRFGYTLWHRREVAWR